MPFEDELGAALRRAGDGFVPDRPDLVASGERRGRRLVARRRAAVVGGSALALAVVGSAGVYGGGLLGTGKDGMANVAAPVPTTPPAATPAPQPAQPAGGVTAARLIEIYRQLLSGGRVSDTTARLPGGADQSPNAMVAGVYDDGKGRAAISVGLARTDPHGQAAEDMLECPDPELIPYDSCAVETLPDGGRLNLFQGYEYPDKREPTKLWRAVLVTREGYQVDVSEWNAPAEKGQPVSRPNPPLNKSQLKSFTTSSLWRQILSRLPAPQQAPEGTDASDGNTGHGSSPGASAGTGTGTGDTTGTTTDKGKGTGKGTGKGGATPGDPRPSGGTGQTPDQGGTDQGDSGQGDAGHGGTVGVLESGIKILRRSGQPGYGALVLDDGKGASLVQVNVQEGMGEALKDRMEGAGVIVLPDGTRVLAEQKSGEKGGSGVVWWSVDTLRPDGRRVVVSAFNTGDQSKAATRAKPILTMEQIKAIALDPKWFG
ncbi:hypothetical protein [Streptomyces sp. H27-H5]|uniref:hypothetical protein n=1 Tax=Streptomyces sp. H27-H5 TaxID=2996460 RepID=UPI002270CBAA|nr:hypothetical protein [Streptomyces sp. H27-H5]MCY0957909.1 hypothetical protein [Streptomyces sp. H27-H5]